MKGYTDFVGGMFLGMELCKRADPSDTKYMDWAKIEKICLENPNEEIEAGLREDWNNTSGTIFSFGFSRQIFSIRMRKLKLDFAKTGIIPVELFSQKENGSMAAFSMTRVCGQLRLSTLTARRLNAGHILLMIIPAFRIGGDVASKFIGNGI